MASQEVWTRYSTQGIINEGEEEVRSMIKDVVETIHTLERMYGVVKAQLVVRALILDYQALAGIANARDIRNYERL
jgi:hypothetical protein